MFWFLMWGPLVEWSQPAPSRTPGCRPTPSLDAWKNTIRPAPHPASRSDRRSDLASLASDSRAMASKASALVSLTRDPRPRAGESLRPLANSTSTGRCFRKARRLASPPPRPLASPDRRCLQTEPTPGRTTGTTTCGPTNQTLQIQHKREQTTWQNLMRN